MLDVFSGRQLQDCKALLLVLKGSGLRLIDQAISAIDATEIDYAEPVTPKLPKKMKLCPHCNEPMIYGPPVDNMVRLGCRKCRYSEVVQ